MLAVSLDDFSVVIIDCDVKKIVRKFCGHSNKISDMVNKKISYSQRNKFNTFLNKKRTFLDFQR